MYEKEKNNDLMHKNNLSDVYDLMYGKQGTTAIPHPCTHVLCGDGVIKDVNISEM